MTQAVRLEATFPASPSSPASLRRMLGSLLEGQGWSAAESADALLAATELATNAVLHARTPFRLTAVMDGDRLAVHLVDWGGGGAEMRSPDWKGVGGLGLRIVDRLTDTWGVRSEDGEQDVRFEVHRRRPAMGRTAPLVGHEPTRTAVEPPQQRSLGPGVSERREA